MVDEIVDRVDYSAYTNRQLAAIPLLVLALVVILVGGLTVMTGAPAPLGIEFTGGTELFVQTTDSPDQIREGFGKGTQLDSVRPVATDENAYILTFQSTNTDAITEQAEQAGYTVTGVSTITPSFGGDSQGLALLGISIAFIGMSIVVFAVYRTFIPCLAVVLSALSDILVPVAAMSLLDIPLTLGTVAALLMLIGYSVDSDILLTTHVLRRGDSFYSSVSDAMRTGLTMTFTSIAAVIVMAISAYAFGIGLIANIGLVLAIGLMADLLNTYLLNVSLLRHHAGINA